SLSLHLNAMGGINSPRRTASRIPICARDARGLWRNLHAKRGGRQSESLPGRSAGYNEGRSAGGGQARRGVRMNGGPLGGGGRPPYAGGTRRAKNPHADTDQQKYGQQRHRDEGKIVISASPWMTTSFCSPWLHAGSFMSLCNSPGGKCEWRRPLARTASFGCGA